jgi:predicted acetyltransferase
MAELMRELRADGVATSSLYPATVPIYRSVGYGLAGVRTFWKTNLVTVPRDRGAALEVFEPDDAGEINEVYERIAAGTNGLISRSPWWWEKRILTPWNPEEQQYRYVVREGGAVTGWIVYGLEKSEGEHWRSRMSCRDLHWTTPEAARALLSLAALHRSTGKDIVWVGPPVEPLADLFGEDPVQRGDTFRYMVRLLDVPAAIEARGYSPLVDAAVTIGVADPLFDENAGPWRVEVSGGTAKVVPEPGARAQAATDVQTWAAMFTSHLRPRDAVRQGRLEASEAALEALDAVFAGPSPWICDFY